MGHHGEMIVERGQQDMDVDGYERFRACSRMTRGTDPTPDGLAGLVATDHDLHRIVR